MPTTLRTTTVTGIVGMVMMSGEVKERSPLEMEGQGGIAREVGNSDGRLKQEGSRSKEVDTGSDADSEEEPRKEDQVGDEFGFFSGGNETATIYHHLVARTTSLSELHIDAATAKLIIDGEDIQIIPEYAKELMELLEGTRVGEGLVRIDLAGYELAWSGNGNGKKSQIAFTLSCTETNCLFRVVEA
ncbi:hypothetical protein K435DRAFT_791572 [Dendrothele bispora CBS 962.96]|uniref:Uncharacterized protein n=1 Tax=Dendrothele bispora (strain CBS 962.96) TaxID=1314807 RepID=A0A4S8MLF2_DENBC|nr:hypothetical protein K435DRAFT_791572 [Dendrothele bispora CBS 962.96]